MSSSKLFTLFFMLVLFGICIHYYLNTSNQTIKTISGVTAGILLFGLLPTLAECFGITTH
jgi:membrane-associated HD superfamily phosphohydrolase